jgi:hypothetical protein
MVLSAGDAMLEKTAGVLRHAATHEKGSRLAALLQCFS